MENKRDLVTTLAYLAVALLLLYSCAYYGAVSEAVRKVAEPIDRDGCISDCEAAGLEMSRYKYETDSCWCALPGGGEVLAHGFLEESR